MIVYLLQGFRGYEKCTQREGDTKNAFKPKPKQFFSQKNITWETNILFVAKISEISEKFKNLKLSFWQYFSLGQRLIFSQNLFRKIILFVSDDNFSHRKVFEKKFKIKKNFGGEKKFCLKKFCENNFYLLLCFSSMRKKGDRVPTSKIIMR